MPKNIEDIIVPEKKRSIRDIPIPEGRRKNNDNFDIPKRERKKFSIIPGKSVWIAAGAALLILMFAILSFFNGATLAYVPKSATLSLVNDVYVADKSGENKLLYSVVKLSKDKGREMPASGTEEVKRKANGKIIVYNNVGTLPQSLVENTRFATPDGLVYRIPSAIVIPGKKIVAGVTQPGSIETIVYADEAGEKYNIGLSDFTVPGLSGTPRFTTIYARSKTEMSGGFIGVEKTVNSQDVAKVKVELESTLKDELTAEVKVQVPKDFIFFPPLSSATFKDLPQTNAPDKGNVTINMRGNLYGIMFRRSDLSNHLARKKITLLPNESVDVIGLDSLGVTFAGTPPMDLLLSDEIKFSVTGETTAVWRTDEVALKADLIGKQKRDMPSILNNYPTVVSATATIRPFWKNSFPSDSARILMKKLPVK